MAKNDKTGAQDNGRRVRVEWLPTYSQMRRFIGVLIGRPKGSFKGLQKELWGLRGTPQKTVDWKDPDAWIDERITGEYHELALAIWTKSGVNPRLLKHLLGERFRFAVLDDVVMSVDRGHRKEFCRLLKTHFPDTQFIITTHDRVWAKQMQTEGLVESKGGLTLQNWSVETGPIVEQTAGIWEKIESDVAKGETAVAASRLRRHMEYIGAELADHLGAKPPFRGDFSYDASDLVSAVIGRHGELLKLGAKAANKWNNEDAKATVVALKDSRKAALDAYCGEQWVLNRAIHFNEWAQFTRAEFREVAAAFKRLLAELRCSSCESWLYVRPRKGSPESLRCDCGGVMVNLKVK